MVLGSGTAVGLPNVFPPGWMVLTERFVDTNQPPPITA